MIHNTLCSVQVKIVGLTQDKEYRLRVFAVNSQGESEPLGCVDSFITENPFQCPGAPGRPGGCQSGGPGQIPDILVILQRCGTGTPTTSTCSGPHRATTAAPASRDMS